MDCGKKNLLFFVIILFVFIFGFEINIIMNSFKYYSGYGKNHNFNLERRTIWQNTL